MPEKRRWQVYSRVNGGYPLYCLSFDRRMEAEAFVDRQIEAHMQERTIAHAPTFEVVDGWA